MRQQDSEHGAGASTEQLTAWDREYLWHPFTPMKSWCEGGGQGGEKEIVVVERGEREFLIDTQGRRYIDGVSSLWCNVHGHCVPELDAAVRGQLGRIAHSTLLGLSNVPAIELGRKLVELARSRGLGLDKVFYSDDGSTAVEVACKMAWQYWQNVGLPRTRFLALANAYHGDTIGAVSVGGIDFFHRVFRGLTFRADFFEAPLHAGDLTARVESLDQHMSMMAGDGGGYAAIIMEPVIQGAGGMLVQARGFLRDVRRLCDKHKVLLIADEVMTAFGRTGKMFACEWEDVTPDFMCLSKNLTGGYMPLGATLTTKRVFDAFYADAREGKTFYHGHTFTGNPLACAVALASLELMEKNRLVERAAELGAKMAAGLEVLRCRKWVRDVRCVGLIGAVELGDEEGEVFPYGWRVGGEVCRRMRDLGLMMRPLGDVIVVMPPLAIEEENLRRLVEGVVQSHDWIESIVARRRAEERV